MIGWVGGGSRGEVLTLRRRGEGYQEKQREEERRDLREEEMDWLSEWLSLADLQYRNCQNQNWTI